MGSLLSHWLRAAFTVPCPGTYHRNAIFLLLVPCLFFPHENISIREAPHLSFSLFLQSLGQCLMHDRCFLGMEGLYGCQAHIHTFSFKPHSTAARCMRSSPSGTGKPRAVSQPASGFTAGRRPRRAEDSGRHPKPTFWPPHSMAFPNPQLDFLPFLDPCVLLGAEWRETGAAGIVFKMGNP